MRHAITLLLVVACVAYTAARPGEVFSFTTLLPLNWTFAAPRSTAFSTPGVRQAISRLLRS